MEPDRASHAQLHLDQLARQAADQLPAIINVIAATTTSTGLRVYARLDENEYPTKIKVNDAELAQVKIERDAFHGDWNYTVYPTPSNRALIKS